MSQPKWTQVVTDFEVPAKPQGLWTLAYEWVAADKRVKITAAGDWKYADEEWASCGPDGDPRSYLSRDDCIHADGPVGALLGKVGGSTADTKGMPFVAGSHTVVTFKAEEEGSLYLTINDIYSGYQDNSGALTVQVYLSA